MLIPFLRYQLIIAQAIEWDKKVRKIKTQRLKSESSGDWQKERSNPQKKNLKTKGFKKRVQKKRVQKKREYKKERKKKKK